MQKRRVSNGMVVLGVVVLLLGVLVALGAHTWSGAVVPGLLIGVGIAAILGGVIGGKGWRDAISQVMRQLLALFILVVVIFPVLWIVGMAMDPRNVLRPLDLSPITNIPANLLRVAPRTYPLPEQAVVTRLQAVGAKAVPNSIQVIDQYYALPEGWTQNDLLRPNVWLVGRDVVEWKPVVDLPAGASTLVFPGQITKLPEGVQLNSLLTRAAAVRPDYWVYINGAPYSTPIGWNLDRAKNPTAWLLDSYVLHWGVLAPLAQDGLVQPVTGDQPLDCYVENVKDSSRYSCPAGYILEKVDQPSFWMAGSNIGLANGKRASTISQADLVDSYTGPAIWLSGHKVLDWRFSSTKSFAAVVNKPTNNPVTFSRLLLNSTFLGVGVSLFCILTGTTAAYAFSRFRFPGRQAGMLGFVIVLMMPSVATLAPLYVILNAVKLAPTILQILLLVVGSVATVLGLLWVLLGLIRKTEGWRWLILPLLLIVVGAILSLATTRQLATGGGELFNLRNSLLGVGVAMVAGALPFSIWNMKGFVDTIPKELEEAALIDGASPTQTFFQIMLPLALPGLAVTALFGFISGWTEFVLSWQFLTNASNFTLAMALYGMQGQYSSNTPWSNFAAMSILVSIPVTAVFFALQKYVVGGLTLGAVKG